MTPPPHPPVQWLPKRPCIHLSSFLCFHSRQECCRLIHCCNKGGIAKQADLNIEVFYISTCLPKSIIKHQFFTRNFAIKHQKRHNLYYKFGYSMLFAIPKGALQGQQLTTTKIQHTYGNVLLSGANATL